jgi:hypothetical protein
LQAQEKAQEMKIALKPWRQLVGRQHKQLQASLISIKEIKKENTNDAKNSKS